MTDNNELVKEKKESSHGNSLYRAEFVELVRAICAETCPTDKQICIILGKYIQGKKLDHQTIINWRNEYSDFNSALIEGRDEFNSKDVEKALLKSAKGFHFTEVTKEPAILRMPGKDPALLAKTLHVTKRVRKFTPPNSRSIQYFLNNRSQERWKNRQIHEITGKDGSPLTITHEARLNAMMDEVREIESAEAKEAEKTAEV